MGPTGVREDSKETSHFGRLQLVCQAASCVEALLDQRDAAAPPHGGPRGAGKCPDGGANDRRAGPGPGALWGARSSRPRAPKLDCGSVPVRPWGKGQGRPRPARVQGVVEEQFGKGWGSSRRETGGPGRRHSRCQSTTLAGPSPVNPDLTPSAVVDPRMAALSYMTGSDRARWRADAVHQRTATWAAT